MSTSKPTQISVESTSEWQINSIEFSQGDWAERYLQPMTFSDHVAHQASKVDWKTVCLQNDSESSPSTPNLPTASTEQKGPWDKVSTLLTQSLTELNVLADVLQISQSKKYIALEPVFEQQSIPEQNKSLVLLGKRKAFQNASQFLQEIASRIRSAKSSKVGLDSSHYQNELLDLRKYWKLKKVQGVIIGDLLYRSFGSKFRPNATFEVRKQESDSSIKITLPKDLHDVCALILRIKRGDETILSTSLPSRKDNRNKPPWHAELLAAQDSVLSKEVFRQLARESVQLTRLTVVVKDDMIAIQLYPDTVLNVYLQVNGSPDFSSDMRESTSLMFLHEALFQFYCKELDGFATEVPRPASAPLGLPRKKRLAGALATPVEDLLVYEQKQDKLLIQRLMDFAKHYTLVHQTEAIVQRLAEEVQDPILSCHWLPCNTLTQASARIFVSSRGVEERAKNSCLIDVGVQEITVTLRDATVVHVSISPDELILILKHQMAEHQLSSAMQMMKMQGWNPLGSWMHSVSEEEYACPTFYASTPNGTRSVHVRYKLDGVPEISVQTRSRGLNRMQEELLKDEEHVWDEMRGELDLLEYESVPGSTFLQKIESVMACLV